MCRHPIVKVPVLSSASPSLPSLEGDTGPAWPGPDQGYGVLACAAVSLFTGQHPLLDRMERWRRSPVATMVLVLVLA